MEIKRNGKNPSKFFSLSKKRLFVNAKNGNLFNPQKSTSRRDNPQKSSPRRDDVTA